MSSQLCWTRRTDELARFVAETAPGLRSELTHWLNSRPRFGAFLEANQDKVPEKLRGAPGEEARLDARAELIVAYLILALSAGVQHYGIRVLEC